MTTARAPLDTQYILHGQDLEVVSSVRYLGVDISSNLSWNTHALFDSINLTQVHNFTVSAQDFYLPSTFGIYRKFYRNFASTKKIMKRFALSYWLVKWLWYRVYNQKVVSSSPSMFFFFYFIVLYLYSIRLTSFIIDVPRLLSNVLWIIIFKSLNMLQLFGTLTQRKRPTKLRWSKEEQPTGPQMIGTGQLVSLHCWTSWTDKP